MRISFLLSSLRLKIPVPARQLNPSARLQLSKMDCGIIYTEAKLTGVVTHEKKRMDKQDMKLTIEV